MTSLLIENGADVNVNDYHYSKPLFFAVSTGNCHLMFAVGSNFCKLVSVFFLNPGRANIVRKLIEHGADVNARDAWNGTALITAAYRGLYISSFTRIHLIFRSQSPFR